MNITIDLPNEIYASLERLAQARGATIAETIEQVLAEVETSRRAAVIEQMRAEGIFLPKAPITNEPRPPYKRIDVQGKPVSECLIEERR